MIERFASPVANCLTLTLLHSLWQGLLIALVYWALLTATGIRSTRIRYTSSLLALGVMSLCPLVTFAIVYDSAAEVDEMLVHTLAASSSGASKASAAPVITHKDGSMSTGREAANRLDSNLGESPEGHRCFAFTQRVFDASQPFVLFLWLAGAMVSGARLTAAFLSFFLLRSGRTSVPPTLANRSTYYASRLGLTSPRVFASTGIREAAVVGFWKPVVFLPTSWLTTLPTDVLEAVIAHELAHIRRYDVWVNLLQRLVEALLFYHPAVWWLSNQIRLEREMCCDELAVDATDDRENYAVALEQVGRLHVQGSRQFAMPFAGDRKMNLLRRIENVLGTDRPAQREPVWLASITAVAIPLLLVATVGIQAGNNDELAQDGKGSRLSKGGPTDERQRVTSRSSSSAKTVSRWELSFDGIPENGRFYKRALLFGDAIDDPLADRSDIIQATVKRPGKEESKESSRIWLLDGKEPIQSLLLDEELTETLRRLGSAVKRGRGKPDLLSDVAVQNTTSARYRSRS